MSDWFGILISTQASCLGPLWNPSSAWFCVAAAAAKSLQSSLTLCNPIDSSPSGTSVPRILQARTLEWVAISSSNVKSESEVSQSCLTRSDPMDCSIPDSSVHGIFQARVLEWGAIVFSNGVLWGSALGSLILFAEAKPHHLP